jgi:hypothetical protein
VDPTLTLIGIGVSSLFSLISLIAVITKFMTCTKMSRQPKIVSVPPPVPKKETPKRVDDDITGTIVSDLPRNIIL